MDAVKPTVEEKVKIQSQLTETAGYLVKVFGQQKAAQMLRGAAAMVAPERAPRVAKAAKK